MSWRPPCAVIWAGSRRRVGIDTGVLQVAGSRLGPGGCFGPALAAAAARAEHAGGRAVHVPVGVLEGASGICGHAGRRVDATRPMGPDGGGHGMKSKQKRGADRLVRRMAKGVRPARMEVDCSGGELQFQRGLGTADDAGRAGPAVRARLGMFHGPPGPVQGGASAGGVAGAADFGSRAGLRRSERSRRAAAGPGPVHGPWDGWSVRVRTASRWPAKAR